MRTKKTGRAWSAGERWPEPAASTEDVTWAWLIGLAGGGFGALIGASLRGLLGGFGGGVPGMALEVVCLGGAVAVLREIGGEGDSLDLVGAAGALVGFGATWLIVGSAAAVGDVIPGWLAGAALGFLPLGGGLLLAVVSAAPFVRAVVARTSGEARARSRGQRAERAGRIAEALDAYATARAYDEMSACIVGVLGYGDDANAMREAAAAYFALGDSIAAARRNGAASGAVLERMASESDAAARLLWSSCGRLTTIGSRPRSERVKAALARHTKSVRALATAFGDARDGLVEFAVGGRVTGDLAKVSDVLRRLGEVARQLDLELASLADAG